MHKTGDVVKIFAGNAGRNLSLKICKELGLPLGEANVGSFSDGEIAITIDESVRGADVFIIQSTAPPHVNTYLMELLIMIDALKRASAGRITAVIPYYGYARQDRKARARDPISAKLVADLLTTAGADRVLTMDLHAAQIQGYFDIPLDHLLGQSLLADYVRRKDLEDMVVVSPDFGSVTRARDFSSKIDSSIAIIEKRRPKANEAEVMSIIGDVKGKNVILIDDMIDTAGTICQAAQVLVDIGAKSVMACCTHAVFSGPAIERLENSIIDEVVILDTIELGAEKRFDKLTILSSAKIFAEAIRRIYQNDSLSELFDGIK
ncbi:MAG: ribose-phosphate pyrophosphokinase [Tissierellia bacterium]|nr:ribose-phosphate pyrophosphokinase [Tissierellia bacterium]